MKAAVSARVAEIAVTAFLIAANNAESQVSIARPVKPVAKALVCVQAAENAVTAVRIRANNVTSRVSVVLPAKAVTTIIAFA